MVYWRTTRIDRPVCASAARPANTTPPGSGRSALASVNEFLWIARFCGLEPVKPAPKITTAPPLVGDAETFWNWPAVMMAGETANCSAPAPELVYAPVVALKVPPDGVPTNGRTTNWRSRPPPYCLRFCGLTALQPAKVTISPTFSTLTVLLQACVRILLVCAQPLVRPCLAPLTVGLPPPEPGV